MTLDANMLAAWKVARDVHGHLVTFTQPASSYYDPSIGTLLETDGAATAVTAIICSKHPQLTHAVDQAVQTFDLVIQVDGADLPRTPRLGEYVEYDGSDYRIVYLTEFTFGIWQIALEGVQQCST